MESLPDLSHAQTEIMNAVWEKGEATVSDVRSMLNRESKLSRNTVQTMLSRLARKGWLKHRKEGNMFIYSATVSQRQAQKRLMSKLVDNVFTGSPEGLVMALLDGRGLTAEESHNIQSLIEKAREETT